MWIEARSAISRMKLQNADAGRRWWDGKFAPRQTQQGIQSRLDCARLRPCSTIKASRANSATQICIYMYTCPKAAALGQRSLLMGGPLLTPGGTNATRVSLKQGVVHVAPNMTLCSPYVAGAKMLYPVAMRTPGWDRWVRVACDAPAPDWSPAGKVHARRKYRAHVPHPSAAECSSASCSRARPTRFG